MLEQHVLGGLGIVDYWFIKYYLKVLLVLIKGI